MSLSIVFNHNSLPFGSQKEIQRHVEEFIKTLALLRPLGFTILIIDPNEDPSLFRIKLAEPNYYWQNWLEEAKSRPELLELTRVLRSFQTKLPFFSIDEKDQDTFTLHLKESNVDTCALKAAYFHETFLLSYPTRAPWNQKVISVEITSLEDDKITEKTVNINNIFDSNSYEGHQEFLTQRRNTLLKNANDILQLQNTLFANLIFLDNFKQNLRKWSGRQDILDNAKRFLLILNEFAMKWQNGQINEYSHQALTSFGVSSEISDESSSIDNNPTKRNARTFRNSEGINVYCTSHIKFGSGYRLHFNIDTKERKIQIGYLGIHLAL